MKRQDKYKDNSTFHFHNQNPKGRYTTDCVKRAISYATGIPYNDVVRALAELQCKTGMDTGEARLYGKYLESLGWVKHPQPRQEDGSKYTGVQFCKWLTKGHSTGNIVANIGGHHIVAIMPIDKRFKVCDTWNSTKGCIGNYWTKACPEG